LLDLVFKGERGGLGKASVDLIQALIRLEYPAGQKNK
jgi:hypothetical protein